MSETFKYLNDSKDSKGSDAAQKFLDEKLSKNKYTSGDPYAMGEGHVPSGEAYKDQLVVKNQAEIDAYNADNPGGSGDFSAAGQYKNMYESGKWGKGSMSAEDLAAKFGLDRSAPSGTVDDPHDGEIWGVDGSGQKVYIGKNTGDLSGNSELASAHGAQKHADEGSHGDEGGMSTGDIEGAVLNLWDGQGGEAEGAPKPEFEMKPIEHSPEIKQAKERVKSYEEDVMSGKTSNEIYGKGEAMASPDYTFDASKGAAAIGASPQSSADSSQAAQSFLNNKLSETKKQLSLT